MIRGKLFLNESRVLWFIVHPEVVSVGKPSATPVKENI